MSMGRFGDQEVARPPPLQHTASESVFESPLGAPICGRRCNRAGTVTPLGPVGAERSKFGISGSFLAEEPGAA